MDCDELFNQKGKYGYMLIMIALFFIIVCCYLSNELVFDIYQCKGVYENGFIYLDIPIDYLDTIKTGEYLKINKKEYSYQIEEIGPLAIESNSLINYQTIKIKIEEEFLENEIINITIYYNEEKIIVKLKNKLWKEAKWK